MPITVRHSLGLTTRQFDQRSNGGRWVLHGRYTLQGGSAASVQVDDGNGRASADAVRFLPVP